MDIDEGTITRWLKGIRDGDPQAEERLWDRFFTQLTNVVRLRLGKLRAESSEEDVALSVMKSVMIGIRSDRFPDLNDRDGLWPLLMTMTGRKIARYQRRHLAEKRSVQREQHNADYEAVAGPASLPELAVEVADCIEDLVKRVDDASLQTIVIRKLEGHTVQEIADELNVSTRTVIRKLNLVRQDWSQNYRTLPE